MVSSSSLKELPTSEGNLTPLKAPLYRTTALHATLPRGGFVQGPLPSRVLPSGPSWREEKCHGLSEFDPAARARVSWNAGRKVGAKRALKPRQIWAIRFFLDQHGRTRDRALFDLAIDSKLRGCALKIKIGDIVYDRKIRMRAIVVQQKTGRPVQFELMDDARASLLRWLELRGGSREDYAFRAPASTPASPISG